MSTYYEYYIGYKTTDKIYHAFGPYTKDHRLVPALVKSRSFASDLHCEFSNLSIDEIDDELKEKFVYKNHNGRDRIDLKYLKESNLPGTNFIKSGYFLTNEIIECMTNNDLLYNADYYFSEYYTESEYAIKLEAAVKRNDEETINELKKFSFFSYPKYNSVEYDSFILSHFLSFNGPLDEYTIKSSLGDDADKFEEVVILLNIS